MADTTQDERSKPKWWGLILALLGGFMLFSGMGGEGGGMGIMGMIGVGLLAIGVVALLAPGLIDKGLDLFNGAKERVGQEIDKARERILGGPSQEQLKTQEADRVNMTTEEKSFEEWALSDSTFKELKEAGKTDELQALLAEMKGKAGNVKLDAISEDDKFLDGLRENLKNEAQQKLNAIGQSA